MGLDQTHVRREKMRRGCGASQTGLGKEEPPDQLGDALGAGDSAVSAPSEAPWVSLLCSCSPVRP